jgi:hypothetical protein
LHHPFAFSSVPDLGLVLQRHLFDAHAPKTGICTGISNRSDKPFRMIAYLWSALKLYRAKRLLKKTPIGEFLLVAAGKVAYQGLSEAQMLSLARTYGFSSPRAVFHFSEGKKRVFYRRNLTPNDLAIVLAHELTHASDHRFLNQMANASAESEAMAVLFQNEFTRQLTQQAS